MQIRTRSQWLKGFKGKGFTASHVWREPADYAVAQTLASRKPELNSFVPNLVWLPEQIAKLTDREGGFAQRYLQKLSLHIYRQLEVRNTATNLIENIWAELPTPRGLDDVDLPALDRIAFFEYKNTVVARRISKITDVRNACREILLGEEISAPQLISVRYKQGLPHVSARCITAFRNWLNEYLDAIR